MLSCQLCILCIPIPIQTLVYVLCCTDKLSENVVDLVSAVVIPWVFVIDNLLKRKKQATNPYNRKYTVLVL